MVADRQLKDPIAVSYLFFVQASTLIPCGFAVHPSGVSSIYCALKDKW